MCREEILAKARTGVYDRKKSTSLRNKDRPLTVETRIELSAFKTVSKVHVTIKVGAVTSGSYVSSLYYYMTDCCRI